MKTILIVEPVIAQLESMMNFCRRSSDNLTIVPARDLQKSTAVLRERHIDLILCSVDFPGEPNCQTLEAIARAFPYIPVVALAADPEQNRDQAQSNGACGCFKKPLHNSELLEKIYDLADASNPGTIQGIPLHSLLQMHENDGQNCTLHVLSAAGEGYIYIEDGAVIDADVQGLTGEEAFYRMISWDEVVIDIKYFNRLRQHQISTPLITLIMEGIRRKDEQEKISAQTTPLYRPKPKLQQASMAGMRLALNIGQELEIEFDAIDSGLESTLVGMIPDQFLIMTVPSHFIVTDTKPRAGQTIVVKFKHLERLFLFRTRICRVLENPRHLLFVDYPSVIHYHDIRRTERAAAAFPCTLKVEDGTQYNGIFKDISSSGALLKVPVKKNDELPDVDIMESIVLSCSLSESNRGELELVGVVKNIKKDERGVQIGLEFQQTYPRRYLESVSLR
jgi:CheY-like chemotaxis protein